jgi:hypothetical protein
MATECVRFLALIWQSCGRGCVSVDHTPLECRVINVREVCFTPINGHHPAALACQFCANSRNAARQNG